MQNTIQVRVDKTHIITIGEKLYGESLELIRELVSNSYDADATGVWIEVDENGLKVKDDGTGMDEAGLRNYFNIGSQNKKFSSISQKYKRTKIGQFGIGKFAVLSACNRFRVLSQRNGYAAEVTFDKPTWEKSDEWHVPINQTDYNAMMGNGTIIKLEEMKKQFTLPEIERFIRERLPLNAPHFSVYLNGKQIEPVYIAGKRFPVAIKTPFGMIQGELIAPNFRNRVSEAKAGIECAVNGVMITRERFELESDSLFILHKLMGRISADFLPITSDRSRFKNDSPEYMYFKQAMQRELRKISRTVSQEATRKGKQKTDQTLKDTLSRLGRAIRRNPVISPKVMTPTGEVDPDGENLNSMAPTAMKEDSDDIEALQITLSPLEKKNGPEGASPTGSEHLNEGEVKKVKVKNLAGKIMAARRIKVGDLGIVCNIDTFGKNEAPVFTQAGVIYINEDHALYKKQEKKGRESLSFYLGYLLSQQIALMFVESDPHKAFEIQNKLLTDSF